MVPLRTLLPPFRNTSLTTVWTTGRPQACASKEVTTQAPRGGHRPEETVLYRAVAEHWQSFRERVQTIGPLPRFVVREVEEYLRCGILEHGFIRVACEGCGFERLVSNSRKRRGFCPSCLGRRMSDGAMHLTEHVLPEVPIRQWVCSLPWGLRALVGFRGCTDTVDEFYLTVQLEKPPTNNRGRPFY